MLNENVSLQKVWKFANIAKTWKHRKKLQNLLPFTESYKASGICSTKVHGDCYVCYPVHSLNCGHIAIVWFSDEAMNIQAIKLSVYHPVLRNILITNQNFAGIISITALTFDANSILFGYN